MDGPDFICIGVPKSGTGWLFDQLKYHPDFWMPPVKELNYLTGQVRFSPVHERLEKAKSQSRAKFLDWSSAREGDPRPGQFLEEAAAAAEAPLDLRSYARLFRYKETRLSGDCTSGYSALPANVIAQVAEALPRTKIILLARDPVERGWSHICMWCRQGVITEETATDPALLSSYIRSDDRFAQLAFPSRIAARWRDNAPQQQFRTFLFDGIVADPHGTRREILLYLGADPSKDSGEVDPEVSRKASRKKMPLGEGSKRVLVEYFQEELRACAEMFGGAAAAWPHKYGL